MSTVVLRGASRRANRYTGCMIAELPIIPGKGAAPLQLLSPTRGERPKASSSPSHSEFSPHSASPSNVAFGGTESRSESGAESGGDTPGIPAFCEMTVRKASSGHARQAGVSKEFSAKGPTEIGRAHV